MPHILAADLAATDNPAVRELVRPDTLHSAHSLAASLRELGEAADGP